MVADIRRRRTFTGRRPELANPPPALGGTIALAHEADEKRAQNEFERQAKDFAQATLTRPALITSAETNQVNAKYTTGQVRLAELRSIVNARLAYWQQEQGDEPFDPLTTAQVDDAQKFFATHGVRLAGEPRVAPPNPIKAKAETSPGAGEPARSPAPAATPVPTPAPAPPPDARSLPASRGAPDPAVALLTRIVKASEAQLAQATALVAEMKGLREQLAAMPAASPAAAVGKDGETIVFEMDALKVGADENTGEKTYKAQGPKYKKFGVRVWPEILPDLGIEESTLKFGENKLPKPLKVRALLTEDGKPRKVIGLAG